MSEAWPRRMRTAVRVLVSSRARQDAWREWQRRLGGEPGLPAQDVERVLVVCEGNLCRSPYAAALLAARLPRLEVRSAGLAARGGDPAAEAAQRAAQERGLDLAAHRTRRLVAEDVAWADLVLGMEGHHAVALERHWPEAEPRIRLLGEFLAEPPFAIEDPWGREDAIFHAVFARVERAVARLAARLEGQPG